ncbi:MAG: helix-turn-helix domain-containing protein [Bacteroides sp.]|nr:helix-turn-helix domain-containing protein [Bacteroides sp.]MCM1548761.1 helix-turn-helix domain-containing protein [Clostridium sp.]
MSSTLPKNTNYKDRIRNIRSQLGLTQEAMAEQLDISYSAYKKLESGENFPSMDTLYKYKKRFHVSADYLLFGELHSAGDTWEQFLNSSSKEQIELYYRILYYVSHFPKVNILTEQEQKEITSYLNEVFPPNPNS